MANVGMRSKPLNNSLRSNFVRFVLSKSKARKQRLEAEKALEAHKQSITLNDFLSDEEVRYIRATPLSFKSTINYFHVTIWEDESITYHFHLKEPLDFFKSNHNSFSLDDYNDFFIELKELEEVYDSAKALEKGLEKEMYVLADNCRTTNQLFNAWPDGETIIREFMLEYCYKTGLPSIAVNFNVIKDAL